MAQLRSAYDDFLAREAKVAAIGMGIPEMAAQFAQTRKIPFTLLVDQRKTTYRALGLARGSLGEVAGPRVWASGAKSILGGHTTGLPKQDPYQLGGAVVVGKGGEIKLIHRAKTSADNLPVAALLDALG